jgi:acetylornithine deacetylase/succinyl-diaminopimelate desuccinylase-like protein
MSLPYEILIRAKDGVLSGAAAYDTPTASARPLAAEELELFGPEINAASLARITELEAELVEARKPAEAPASPPLIATLGATYATLPNEIQVAFAASFATVRALIQADRTDLAAAYVAALTVPEELESVRQGILAQLTAE